MKKSKCCENCKHCEDIDYYGYGHCDIDDEVVHKHGVCDDHEFS